MIKFISKKKEKISHIMSLLMCEKNYCIAKVITSACIITMLKKKRYNNV